MRPSPTPRVDRLVADLVPEDGPGPLAAELAEWIRTTPRFGRFVETHRDKIRKKLRSAAEDQGRLDVRAELRAAARLLADRRIDLEWEPRGAARGGPDFHVTFRGLAACFLEVTRLRGAPDEPALVRVVLAKLKQLPTGTPTVLVVAVAATDATRVPTDAALRGLRARVDAGDPDLLRRGGSDGPRAFYDRFLRLGAIIAWCDADEPDHRAAAWVNRSARLVLPAPVLGACLDALRGTDRTLRRGRLR